jgi:hypothetical protein
MCEYNVNTVGVVKVNMDFSVWLFPLGGQIKKKTWSQFKYSDCNNVRAFSTI